jgi:type IV pilus assembly protein PilN
MPRINLLPWREADRLKRQRAFLVSISGALVLGVLVAGLVNFVVVGMIDYPIDRNDILRGEIRKRDEPIAEINGLEQQKERLIARMDIIERLQSSRPEVVHLFDQVARQIPEGVYLTAMKQAGTAVEVTGIAQSSTRVSALMRRIDASEWMTEPGVVTVETTEQGAGRRAKFVVTLKQIKIVDGEDAE